MTNIPNRIINFISRYITKKSSSGCNAHCPYYELYRKDYQNYQNDDQYNCKYQEDIKKSVKRLIKANEKYFTYEIERTTIDCIIHDTDHIKTFGYSQRVAYEIFEKYGVFVYVSDLGTYINSPRQAEYELRRLIKTYGIERVTEEIAIYIKSNYPQFGINIVCTN